VTALQPRTVAVVGAGWAGIAAAVTLVRRGQRVVLHEMAPAAGGRARRLEGAGPHPAGLDNGQHIAIGAYRATLGLLETVGIDPGAVFLRTPLALVDPRGDGLVLGAGRTDLAFARAVLARGGWSWRERYALLAAAFGWRRSGFSCAPDATVDELVAGLPPRVRREVVEPLCVAALNTASREASATVFLRVLRDAFAAPGGADLLLPIVDLSALLVDPALAWLRARGAAVRLGSRVQSLERTAGGWRIDGARADGVVLACTATEAARLVDAVAPGWARRAAAFLHEPIVTVYAASAGTRLARPMLQLASDDALRPAQFVFDRGALGGPSGLLAFVVSGARAWVGRGAAETERAVLAQGSEALDGVLRAPLVPVRTVVEKRATFRCVPGLDRPPATIAPGLIAAGDYVEGPYPSTLEGAVRSGVEAAEGAGDAAGATQALEAEAARDIAAMLADRPGGARVSAAS
jgi:squalene-associated FAD-dependent desaturase